MSAGKGGMMVGVLGGLGPEATVDFMARVLALTPAESDQDHIHLLVDQNPHVPNRQEAILRDGEDPSQAIVQMAKRLEDAGCGLLVMPCNTAHAWEDDIRAATSVPFVSIVDATVAAIPEIVSKVGLMTTPAGLSTHCYQRALSERGIETIEHDEAGLTELMKLVNSIKIGEIGSGVTASMKRLADELVERGAELIIFGCTEIPIVLDASELDVPALSSTDELAKRTIAIARGDEALLGR